MQQIGPFLEVSRYVPDEEADTKVTPSDIGTGGQSGSGNQAKKTTKNENASRVTKSGSGGNIYELFQGEDGANPAKKVTSNQPPEVVWKTITDGSRGIGELDDRAARYLAGPGVILANQDFRVIQDTIQQCLKPYKQIPAARQVVEQTVRDWYGFYLQQTVIMGESLRGSERWVGPCIKQLLSEEALTASILTKWSIMEQVKKDVAIRIRESRKAS